MIQSDKKWQEKSHSLCDLKEDLKKPLCSHMISLSMYKTPKIKKKNLLELISNYSKAAGYGVIIQNQ